MNDWDFEKQLENELLHFVAGEGDADAVLQLLANGRDPNAFDDCGNTPLHYAAEGEHFEVVRILLAKGARVNACDDSRAGNTALAHVAQTCSLKMAQLLIDAGADPTISGSTTALHESATRKRGDGPAVHELLCRVAGRPAPKR